MKTIYKLTSENYKKENFFKNSYILTNLKIKDNKKFMKEHSSDIFMFLIRYVIPKVVFTDRNELFNNFFLNYEKNQEEYKFVYLLMILYKIKII